MQTLFLDSVGSTQTHLKNLLKTSKLELPFVVVSDIQTDGLGSRDNSWTGLDGNLFLSFAVSLEELPKDLRLESSSIYFSWLLKDVLTNLNSSVWIKWPNDFYIDDAKIGGMITNIVGNSIVCGVGLNLVSSPEGFRNLDIVINKENLLELYFKNIEKKISWKQVFSKYKLEFPLNQKFCTHNNNLKISLADAKLQSDGSIVINGERIYSSR